MIESPLRTFGSLPFTPERFHVLLNSLFKVLFNFPSRYLFAIGLVVIFSLRWSLPPTWCSTLKEHDSEESSSREGLRSLRAWHPLRAVAPFKGDLDSQPTPGMMGPPTHDISLRVAARDFVLGFSLFARRYLGNPG